jgi:hypothetical protein
MDKRKLRLILLAVVGIIILVIGIKAAMIYSGPLSWAAWWDYEAKYWFGKSAASLTSEEEAYIREFSIQSLIPFEQQVEFARQLDLERRTAEFTAWLVKWVVIPIGLFAILTAALVVSRVISNRLRPPSNPN